MIVADTNLISYLLIAGDFTPQAEAVLRADSVWATPVLWRSEFRNVLTLQIRHNGLPLETALRILDAATELLHGSEYQLDAAAVMRTAVDGGCSAYDAEYITLARDLRIPLITFDKQLLSRFQQIAQTPAAFLAARADGEHR